jgi:hypothetical protein
MIHVYQGKEIEKDEKDGAYVTHSEVRNAYKLSVESFTTPRAVRE